MAGVIAEPVGLGRRTTLRATGRLLTSVLVATLVSSTAIAAGPIASSNFAGAENPLSENGAWAAITSLSPHGTRFQKSNGAQPNQVLYPDHAGARSTAVVPADQYSEIVVGHVGSAQYHNVGPIVRVQASGPSVDSHYLWWAAATNGVNNLYRIDANGTSYTASLLTASSPIADGDTLRLIARGPVLYGIKNGVRDFIYNTGRDATTYSAGAPGMLAYSSSTVANATIASWSTGAAPVSSGTWASSNFAGIENPLDEGDRWYPLPGYTGFRKAGGLASGLDWNHNVTGVWSITAPAKQYSEVTLGTVANGGGGPVVRIDRTNNAQTGWLLFLAADSPHVSGIYKINPDGSFTGVRLFTPLIVSGDKWRLAADGNILEVLRNGQSQFTYATDGSYAAGDVGMDAYTPAFTFMGWEGGAFTSAPPTPDTQPPTAPGALTAIPLSGGQINLMWTAATDNVGVTGYLLERCLTAVCTFAQIATVAGTSYTDGGLAANTGYTYRVRATDAARNLGPYSDPATATTLAF